MGAHACMCNLYLCVWCQESIPTVEGSAFLSVLTTTLLNASSHIFSTEIITFTGLDSVVLCFLAGEILLGLPSFSFPIFGVFCFFFGLTMHCSSLRTAPEIRSVRALYRDMFHFCHLCPPQLI